MRNNKLDLTKTYYSYILPQHIEQPEETSKYRYTPQKSVIFSYQNHQQHKKNDLRTYFSHHNKGVFSLDKINVDKFKQHKQLLQNSKMPSFNIKKLIDKSIKKRKQARTKEVFSEDRETHKKNTKMKIDFTKEDLNNYWQNYIHQELSAGDLTKQLVSINKNMGVIVNKARKNKSEFKYIQEQIDFRNTGEQKNNIFVNNFIKTRYKRKNNDSSSKLRKQLSLKQKKNLFQRGISDRMEGDWVRPWQKHNDTQEEQFNGF